MNAVSTLLGMSLAIATMIAPAVAAAAEARTPAPALRTAAATPLRLPAALVFRGAEGSPGRVTFDHQSHVDEKKPACTTCHPTPFRILRNGPVAPARIVHASMEKGRQCGACHDGRRAFGLDQCDLCHRAE